MNLVTKRKAQSGVSLPAGADVLQPVPVLHREHLHAQPHARRAVLRDSSLRPQRLQCPFTPLKY